MISEMSSQIRPKNGGQYGVAFTGLESILKNEPRVKQWTNVGVLLTDGRPGDARSTYTTIALRLQKQYNLQFQMVCFGQEGQSAMKTLTRVLDGKRHQAGFVKTEIVDTFQQISTLCSSLRGDVSLTLRQDIQREPASSGKCISASPAAVRDAWLVLRDEKKGNWDVRGHQNVRLHRGSFAEGGLRLAYHMFVPDSKKEDGELHLVVKQSKFESKAGTETIDDVHRQFLETHDISKRLAGEFRKAKKAAFTKLSLIHI